MDVLGDTVYSLGWRASLMMLVKSNDDIEN